MKKFIGIFAMIFVSLVLGAGLFISCSTAGEDNSDLTRAEKEAAEWTKLNNIGIYIHGTDNGDITERNSSADGVVRKYSDDTKKYAVIYFEAEPKTDYVFSFDNVKDSVSTTPASTDIKVEKYTAKPNYFSVTVPIETEKVNIDKSTAFVTQQP